LPDAVGRKLLPAATVGTRISRTSRGDSVEVKGARQTDNSVLAIRVERNK
jgi:hypothetical protein